MDQKTRIALQYAMLCKNRLIHSINCCFAKCECVGRPYIISGMVCNERQVYAISMRADLSL